MKSKCRLVPISDDMQAVAITEFLQFLEPMRGIAGTVTLGHSCHSVCHGSFLSVQQAGDSRVSSPMPLFTTCEMKVRYVVGSLDVSVYPANVDMVKSAFNTLGSVCAMAGSHCGWVMLPMYQSQTTQQAWLKHRRSISEALHKMNLNVTNEVAILFEKPEGSRDGRPMQQPAQVGIHSNYFSSSPWLESKALLDGRIESCQLIKITDFIGYDPEAQRPGASSRVEQTHGYQF